MRVAALGAGYAGLTLARKLDGSLPETAELIVVDEAEGHVVQHELHRVVRRPSLAEDISVPLDEVLDCEIRQASVTDVDPEAGVAQLDGTPDLKYDVGAVCLGAETDFHDSPGLSVHATPLKRLSHAREIRERFLDVLEWGGRTVVGGAGLSGVQVAGELAAMVDERGADDSGPEIVLLEQFDSVTPTFDEGFQRAVHDELTNRGVTVRTGTAVEAVEDDEIALSTGEALAYDQLIWTGGIRGSTALDGERPIVRSDLRFAGDTFVVGDAGRVVDANGEAAPASAQTAIREARVAGKNIRALVEHRLDGSGDFEPRMDRYTYDSLGWLVSVGDGAVAQVGGTVLTGWAALALKTSVGAGYLGSVGAVENAVELVQEELGLAVDAGNRDGDASTGEAVDDEIDEDA